MPLDVTVRQRVAADLLVAEVVQVARQPAECPEVGVDVLLCAAAGARAVVPDHAPGAYRECSVSTSPLAMAAMKAVGELLVHGVSLSGGRA